MVLGTFPTQVSFCLLLPSSSAGFFFLTAVVGDAEVDRGFGKWGFNGDGIDEGC